ncbi:hypothetical protein [Rhizorhabdus wittichii]|jgi:hypothetical protein|uniref:Uncharacterized protein n=1 Tax=Rhizorhabdus wittichii TaxID=160791 RepID=A0A975HCQ9_9SPHN|nr:hypothetical protein [Rhizorhabdus wittichii]ARR54058.1 hypothetical protein HY78_11750 [Rhizorhabdus wittichii DC-6]QTH20503.1 hypothetical protein HRJ34_19500 [Rhizorhabdus wittichii]
MDTSDTRKLRETLDLLGIRAQATAAGMVQMMLELHRAGVLDDAAVDRVKGAICGDLMLSCPQAIDRREYEASLRRRLDALFAGQEPIGRRMPAFGERPE